MLDIGLLRLIRDDEIELMRAWRNAPSVRANMYTRHEIGAREHSDWWERVKQRSDVQYFMYELLGSPSGVVGFTGIDRVNNNSSWAFYASPEAAKGTGTMMEYLALERAFGELGLHKLHCEVLAFNGPVIKLHQKFGFKVEGVMREHHLVDGGFVDIYKLGILDREWIAQRPLIETKIAAFRGKND